MEVNVTPKNLIITWKDGDFKMVFRNFCFYLKPYVKPFKEALSAGTELKENIFIEDQVFFFLSRKKALCVFLTSTPWTTF